MFGTMGNIWKRFFYSPKKAESLKEVQSYLLKIHYILMAEEIKVLAEFYGKEAQVQYAGITYTSPPLLDKDDLLSEWKIFRRAFLLGKKSIMEHQRLQHFFQSFHMCAL